MTPADHFRAIGEALFGPTSWQRELGRRLNVNERQIRRWAHGEYAPPDGVWRELDELCAEHIEALTALRGKIRDAAA